MKPTGQRNQCPTCGAYFNRTSGFEKHRVGEIGNDRRCLSAYEMTMRGWTKNKYGFWLAPLNARDKARQECRLQLMGKGKTDTIRAEGRLPYAETDTEASTRERYYRKDNAERELCRWVREAREVKP